MIGAGTAKKAAQAVVGVTKLAGDLVRHAAWYVTYQAGGEARESDRERD